MKIEYWASIGLSRLIWSFLWLRLFPHIVRIMILFPSAYKLHGKFRQWFLEDFENRVDTQEYLIIYLKHPKLVVEGNDIDGRGAFLVPQLYSGCYLVRRSKILRKQSKHQSSHRPYNLWFSHYNKNCIMFDLRIYYCQLNYLFTEDIFRKLAWEAEISVYHFANKLLATIKPRSEYFHSSPVGLWFPVKSCAQEVLCRVTEKPIWIHDV